MGVSAEKPMIANYSEYIDRFLFAKGLKGAKSPGEHHFVAAYLLPKLFEINSIVPDYINPDGTKGITGDIVYFEEGRHSLGIEVKFGSIRLTKNEFNSWIVNEDTSQHPDIFIGIGTKGIIVLPWHEFREAYLSTAEIKEPTAIQQGYGPQKSVDVLFAAGKGTGYFPRSADNSEAQVNETRFVSRLQALVLR